MNNETILVVDDNHQIANLLAGNILPRLGYETLVAYDGKTALEIIRKHQFYISLMLLDLQLPDYNGLELLRLLANEGYSVPTVLITAQGSEQVAADAFRLGVQDYLIKPVDHDHLSRVVSRVLTEGRLRQEKARLTTQLKEQVSWLTVLSNVGQSVTSTLELDEVLRRIVEGGVYLTHAEEGFLALLDNQTGQLYMRAVKNLDQDRSKTLRLPVTNTMVGTVLQSGRPLRMTRSSEGPALKVSTGFLVHSLLHVPLISKGKPFGVLTVDNRSTPQPFKEIDETMLTSLADYAAVAIENASLYQQSQQEIAERKRVEEVLGSERNLLRTSKSDFEQLIASLSSSLIVFSADLCITHWNPKASQILGFQASQVLGHPLKEIPIQWDWEVINENIDKCRNELRPMFLDPVRFKRVDGQDGYLGINISPIRGNEDQLSGYILLCGDITERKILENRMAQASKLESIGQLAAGIAHEINTPIQYVGDNTVFLQDNYISLLKLLRKYDEFFSTIKGRNEYPELITQLDEARQEADLTYLYEEIPIAIQQSLEGIHRVTEIVSAMKEFSHPGVKEKTALDINNAITHTLTVARNELKYVADVETDLDPNLPQVVCLPGEIGQVFLNIIVNAAHAIAAVVEDGKKGKGIIKICTRQERNWVDIRISDTGPGIPEENKPHIFEPFFTTKEVGKGTGQGLAMAYDVIERKHGGTITFDTEIGKGTTFIIRLPVEPIPEKI